MIDRDYLFGRDRDIYYSGNRSRRVVGENTTKSTRSNEKGYGCGCGCLVPVVALAGAVLGFAAGLSCSVRVPFTDANVSAGASVGHSDKTEGVLADYLQPRVAGDTHFANNTHKAHIWKLGTLNMSLVGEQPEAPLFDLYFDIDKK